MPWAAQARAMNSVSMSTAEAPDSAAIRSPEGLRLKEAVSESYREDGEKAGVAEIVIVARFEGG